MNDSVVHITFHKDKNISRFIEAMKKLAIANGIEIIFDAHELDPGECCFAEDEHGNDIIMVDTSVPFDQWFASFLHICGHLEQHIEQPDAYINNYTNGVDSQQLLELWVARDIELDSAQLKKFITAHQDVELDCEKRVVEKIKKFKLPIDIEQYIQKANAYIWSFSLLPKTRNWANNEPSEVPDVWSVMPKDFNENYFSVPLFVENLMLRLCFSSKIYRY